MKNIGCILVFCTLLVSSAKSQSEWYISYGGEMLFSFADVSQMEMISIHLCAGPGTQYVYVCQ
jgi:hypothetical protein